LMAAATHNGTDNLSQCSIDTITTKIETSGSCLTEDNTSEPEVVVTVPPVIARNGGGGSMGILALQVLFTFILFRMWINFCFAGAFGIRADTPDRDVVIYMAKFWGMIVLMLIMVYHIIKSIIGLV